MKKIRLRRRTGSSNSAGSPEASKPKLPKLISGFDLFKAAWQDFRIDWKPYLKILAVITLPMDLLGLISFFASDPLANSYASFAAIVMNIALIWAIMRRQRTGRVPTVAEAYYQGTAGIVRYILASLAVVAMLVPSAIALAIYAVAILAGDASGVQGPELILMGIVCLIVAAPSAYLIVRYALTPLVVLYDDLRPMAALRRSRLVTTGYFWPVLGRMLLMAIFLALTSIPATLISLGISILNINRNLATVVFEILSTFVALPLANLYLIGLYRDLFRKNAGVAAEEARLAKPSTPTEVDTAAAEAKSREATA